ncbi:MAG: DUF4388 domain-containing protein, partial [Myxococcota bacterium]
MSIAMEADPGDEVTIEPNPEPSPEPVDEPGNAEPTPTRASAVMALVAETLDDGTASASEPDTPPSADFGELPPPMSALEEAPAREPVGVFALPPDTGQASNVFGEIASPLTTLQESIAGYAETHSEPVPEIQHDAPALAPTAELSEPAEEAPLPEIELDQIVDTSPNAMRNVIGAAPVTAPDEPLAPVSEPAPAAPNETSVSAEGAGLDPAPVVLGAAEHDVDPVHVMTPSGQPRRATEEEIRESLPEPGVEDLPMGPAGSLGLRGEQTPRLPPGVPSAGDLSSMPLPRLLYELYLSSFTGVLTLNNRGDRRRVFVWGGFPVRVETSHATENLTHMLRKNGRITDEEHRQVEDKIRAESLRAGDALRALGLLSDRELLDAMRFLNEERMVNTFAWREGTYTFDARADFADGTVFGEVHPLSVIWRGIHDHYDLAVLFEYFSALRTRYVVTTQAFSVHYPALGPFLQHLDVKEILSGRTTFEQALRSDDSRAIELSQLLYFLLVTDMVKPQARPGDAPTEFAEQPTAEPTPRPQAVDYRELAAVSEKIAAEYLRLKDADYFAALGLNDQADLDA